MKKILLVLVVMVAFATGSYAWTVSDNFGARVFAEEGQNETLSTVLPSGFGHTYIFVTIHNSVEQSYASVSSSSGGFSLAGYGFADKKLTYYAGTTFHMQAFAGLGGYSNVVASYY